MPRCYAYPNASFYPIMRLIASISNTNPAVVTTTFAHQYVDGIIVRLDVPFACGMQQINTQTTPITIIDDTSFSTDIDSTLFDAFVLPDPDTTAPSIDICAQVVPFGEVNDTLYAATQNVLPRTTLEGD